RISDGGELHETVQAGAGCAEVYLGTEEVGKHRGGNTTEMSLSDKIKLKVCGMRDAENIAEVAALSPDYMGFIFYDKSPRFVGEHFVIPEELSPTISRVGVFVKAGAKNIENAVRRHRLDVVQLHGGETVDEVSKIKSLGVEVWKVFSV